MDFQEALSVGYYFDRCIDLEFYSTDMQFLGKLVTPKNGMKPTITIKGQLIPGDYSINSYILVQNMTYDIDIANIGYIKAHMYYSGIAESSVHTELLDRLKKGHDITYSVLYFDQDKEPPNRCVRFQCVVASQDTTRFETPVYVSGSLLEYGTDIPRQVNITDKEANTVTDLMSVAKQIANIYNKGLKLEQFKSFKLKDEIGITAIEIDTPLIGTQVVLPKAETLGEFIRELNSQEDSEGNNPFKIVIVTGKVLITRPLPIDWKAQAGNSKEKQKQFVEDWLKEGHKTYLLDSGINGRTYRTENEPVPLSYVRYATRTENIVNIETMFDDRIKPNCYIKINSKAIMGKKRAGSGSRLINYDGEILTLQITADIEYLFSTTEDSYMKIKSVVVGEERYKEGGTSEETLANKKAYVDAGAEL